MLEYTSKVMAEGLRTEDVSRIAHQLLSAVDHCDRHNVIHRDIKPENIMFKDCTKTAELRLIDFGCAALDSDEDRGKEHNTYAGTAFYNSPEMFQKRYTSKTDVFSAGVVLYVLVAGYPAERLQGAFNLLQRAERDLKILPGMPEDMPETYYAMLNDMLTYRWKGRKSAGEMLGDEFVAFHQDTEKRPRSLVLLGTGEKAAASVGFVKFQWSLTTILASMLERGDIASLVSYAESKVSADDKTDSRLEVIEVIDVKSILETMGKSDCVAAIEEQKKERVYDNCSYEYTLLKPYTREPGVKHDIDEDAPSSTRDDSLLESVYQSFSMFCSSGFYPSAG